MRFFLVKIGQNFSPRTRCRGEAQTPQDLDGGTGGRGLGPQEQNCVTGELGFDVTCWIPLVDASRKTPFGVPMIVPPQDAL